jgi:hypothetical protein
MHLLVSPRPARIKARSALRSNSAAPNVNVGEGADASDVRRFPSIVGEAVLSRVIARDATEQFPVHGWNSDRVRDDHSSWCTLEFGAREIFSTDDVEKSVDHFALCKKY